MDGSCLAIPRTKDKHYLYTCNPSPIHHASNKINHYLKIVDFYIDTNCPKSFIIEPQLGCYEPDIFFKDGDKSVCVEIQITPISMKKMQEKYDSFVKEYGREHDSNVWVLCSDVSTYNKLATNHSFKIIRKRLPREVEY